MKYFQQFTIPFVGLKTGKTVLTYEINGEFFKHFEGALIDESDLYVHLTFDKRPGFFVLEFFIDGSIRTNCDRCLEEFDLAINGNYRLYVKFSDEPGLKEEEPDVIYIQRGETELNVAQYIYEYINLSIPLQKTCEMDVFGEKKCNEEVIKYITQKQPEVESTPKDARWDALENLRTE